MISDFEISQLIMSRIFHDLAGPIGAMNNGAEFLKESRSDVHQKAIDLMQLSSSQAVSRLQVFKAVFGYAPANAEVSLNKIRPMIDSYFKASKVLFNWKNSTRPDEINMTNAVSRVLILSILLVTTSLIYGGNVEIDIDSSNESKITFTVNGHCNQGIKIEKDAVQLLIERNFDLVFNSQNVIYLYAIRLIDNLNGQFNMEYTGDSVTIKVTVDNVLIKHSEIASVSIV